MRLSILAASMVFCAAAAQAQSLVSLKTEAPDGADIGFLLTDGRVLCQGNKLNDWWTLTPDASGQYVTGTWKQVGSLPAGYVPNGFASAVLADGRVVITGGEYNNDTFLLVDLGAVFDPATNTWTSLKAPAGWNYIGDSPSTVLPNGKLLLGSKLDDRIAELDPKTLTWAELGYKGKQDFNAEEGWTLLPDGTILTSDVKASPHTERYSAALQRWSSLGNTPVVLGGPSKVGPKKYPGGVYDSPGEVGPAILQPNGTVFATGATPKGGTSGHSAIYTPGAGGASGTWKAGPDFGTGEDAGESFAALLPSGNVLVEADTGRLYEFDGTKLNRTHINVGGNSLLVLPTGEILVGGQAVYRSTGRPQASWAPSIATYPATIKPGSSYKITGTQFNGLSQANAFGNKNQTATNYPLVRITNHASGHVVYARTHDHSTMGVATGKAVVFTNFDVPSTIETGDSMLQVVANGIASAGVTVSVAK